jgi:hypothetical protein
LFELVVDAPLRRLGQGQLLQAGTEALRVGGAVVLGDTQLFLDDLQLLAKKELALLRRYLLVDLIRDLAAQLGDLALLAQQLQHFLHPRLQRQRVEYLLQLLAAGRGQGRGEICELAGLVRIEVGDVLLELLAVQRIQRQQFLHGLEHGHRIGLDAVAVAIALAAWILDLHAIRRLVTEPAQDTEAAQALGEELAGILGHHRRTMQAHDAAHLREMARLRLRRHRSCADRHRSGPRRRCPSRPPPSGCRPTRRDSSPRAAPARERTGAGGSGIRYSVSGSTSSATAGVCWSSAVSSTILPSMCASCASADASSC